MIAGLGAGFSSIETGPSQPSDILFLCMSCSIRGGGAEVDGRKRKGKLGYGEREKVRGFGRG